MPGSASAIDDTYPSNLVSTTAAVDESFTNTSYSTNKDCDTIQQRTDDDVMETLFWDIRRKSAYLTTNPVTIDLFQIQQEIIHGENAEKEREQIKKNLKEILIRRSLDGWQDYNFGTLDNESAANESVEYSPEELDALMQKNNKGSSDNLSLSGSDPDTANKCCLITLSKDTSAVKREMLSASDLETHLAEKLRLFINAIKETVQSFSMNHFAIEEEDPFLAQFIIALEICQYDKSLTSKHQLLRFCFNPWQSFHQTIDKQAQNHPVFRVAKTLMIKLVGIASQAILNNDAKTCKNVFLLVHNVSEITNSAIGKTKIDITPFAENMKALTNTIKHPKLTQAASLFLIVASLFALVTSLGVLYPLLKSPLNRWKETRKKADAYSVSHHFQEIAAKQDPAHSKRKPPEPLLVN